MTAKYAALVLGAAVWCASPPAAFAQLPGAPANPRTTIVLDAYETDVGNVGGNPSFGTVSINGAPAVALNCAPVAKIPTCQLPAGVTVVSGYVLVTGCSKSGCEKYSDLLQFIDTGGNKKPTGLATSFQFFSDIDPDKASRDVGFTLPPASARSVTVQEDVNGIAKYAARTTSGTTTGANAIVVHSDCSDGGCTVVPEPSSAVLAGSGLLVLFGVAWDAKKYRRRPR